MEERAKRLGPRSIDLHAPNDSVGGAGDDDG